MRHAGLKLRMVFVGTILFAFYAAIAGFLLMAFGTGIWPIVLLGTILFAGFQYKIGKWMALRSVGAEDMPTDGQYGQVHDIIEHLSNEMGVEKPRLMHARMGVPNAFATGRKGAGVVVVSDELMQLLDRDELEGVLAHEMAHIKNRDVVTMVLGQSIASMVGIAIQWTVILAGDSDIADWILGWIAGTIAQLLVMIFVLAISRYREYVADSDAREYVGSGEPLARALEKIQQGNERASDSRLDESTSALCIFGTEKGLLQRLFATHPPVEKRIDRLRSA